MTVSLYFVLLFEWFLFDWLDSVIFSVVFWSFRWGRILVEMAWVFQFRTGRVEDIGVVDVLLVAPLVGDG